MTKEEIRVRQSIVNHLSALVEAREKARKSMRMRPGISPATEAIKEVARGIATGRY